MSAEKLVKLSEKDLLCVVGGSNPSEEVVVSVVEEEPMYEQRMNGEALTPTQSLAATPEPVSDNYTFIDGVKYGFLEEGVLGALNFMRTAGVDRCAFGCLIAVVIKLLPVFGAGYLFARFNQPPKKLKNKK